MYRYFCAICVVVVCFFFFFFFFLIYSTYIFYIYFLLMNSVRSMCNFPTKNIYNRYRIYCTYVETRFKWDGIGFIMLGLRVRCEILMNWGGEMIIVNPSDRMFWVVHHSSSDHHRLSEMKSTDQRIDRSLARSNCYSQEQLAIVCLNKSNASSKVLLHFIISCQIINHKTRLKMKHHDTHTPPSWVDNWHWTVYLNKVK